MKLSNFFPLIISPFTLPNFSFSSTANIGPSSPTLTAISVHLNFVLNGGIIVSSISTLLSSYLPLK